MIIIICLIYENVVYKDGVNITDINGDVDAKKNSVNELWYEYYWFNFQLSKALKSGLFGFHLLSMAALKMNHNTVKEKVSNYSFRSSIDKCKFSMTDLGFFKKTSFASSTPTFIKEMCFAQMRLWSWPKNYKVRYCKGQSFKEISKKEIFKNWHRRQKTFWQWLRDTFKTD